MEGIENSVNVGTIKCQLYWDGKKQGVFALAAIPQIDSCLLIEATDSMRAYRVTGTAMTAVAIPEAEFNLLDKATCLTYVKVYLEEDPEGVLYETVVGLI